MVIGGLTFAYILTKSDDPTKLDRKGRKYRELSEDASRIFANLLMTRYANFADNDLLTEESKKEIAEWQTKFRKAIN